MINSFKICVLLSVFSLYSLGYAENLPQCVNNTDANSNKCGGIICHNNSECQSLICQETKKYNGSFHLKTQIGKFHLKNQNDSLQQKTQDGGFQCQACSNDEIDMTNSRCEGLPCSADDECIYKTCFKGKCDIFGLRDDIRSRFHLPDWVGMMLIIFTIVCIFGYCNYLCFHYCVKSLMSGISYQLVRNDSARPLTR
ncbi:hypothetical protein FGO68_gene680 [Halteria grandinella]|uniref:Uncharacterized protein n=1 Tax=Halteria grandinella TaxID=5974 RepID=A0A8J8NKG8_HALGN|nr:hypothetical protein FGO68_gene680 [Halteria grandinella]